jgi:ubiquinone/menaquinone biosynthesis C-methylase UbiE
MTKIFISYPRSAKNLVARLVLDLSASGHETWFDERLNGGVKWWDEILSEVRRCEILVVALTRDFQSSLSCQEELSYAQQLGKPILPVRISGEVSQDALPASLREYLWVDYSERSIDALLKLQQTLNSLPKTVRMPDPPPDPPPLPTSLLRDVQLQVKSVSQLGLQEQINIVFELRQQLRSGDGAQEIVALVQGLKKRDDLYAKVAQDLDFLLREIEIAQVGQTFAKRSLPPEELIQKLEFVEELGQKSPLPGSAAPPFDAKNPTGADDLLIRPSAYPLTPMYLLDNAFRIIDWNQAFSVAFDRTMEGRKGESVLQWTYFLDNWKDVIDHGQKVFGNKGANDLPKIDKEEIKYNSLRYDHFSATKRAYQIPDDDGVCLGWLITLELKFVKQQNADAFRRDLLGVLGRDLMWSEYAVSYDRVLNNTKVYPQLLETFLGGYDSMRAIPQNARIIDLGAGTGNLTHRLISTGRDRLIVAAENNRMMLEILKEKCKEFLRSDAQAGGIIPVKQDITSLLGLEDDYFDFALMNNVLYAIDDVEACLQEVLRVLKPGGELRLSGPRKDTNIQLLFDRIMLELKESRKFSELELDYWHAKRLNELRLSEWLYRWTTEEVEKILIDAGFSTIIFATNDVYCKQSMFISAQK